MPRAVATLYDGLPERMPGVVGLTDRATGNMYVRADAPGCVIVHEAIHHALSRFSTDEFDGEEEAVRASLRQIAALRTDHPVLQLLFNGDDCP